MDAHTRRNVEDALSVVTKALALLEDAVLRTRSGPERNKLTDVRMRLMAAQYLSRDLLKSNPDEHCLNELRKFYGIAPYETFEGAGTATQMSRIESDFAKSTINICNDYLGRPKW